MTVDQIIKAADFLAINPTNATIGSESWQCWADRVQQASSLHDEASAAWKTWHGQFNEAAYLALNGDKSLLATPEADRLYALRDEAIAEANRYAM